MINEIKKEAWHIFVLVIILAYGLMFCDIQNRITLNDQALYESQFNSAPQEGSGWIDAIVTPI